MKRVRATIINVILLAVAIAVIAASARSRYRARQNPRPRPGYVPAIWSEGPWTAWLSERPRHTFWYLVLIPTAGLIVGVILLAAHDEFGALLILAAVIGAWRIRRSARRALHAARAEDTQPPRDAT